ncbi:MAG: S41 family peptidase [Sphingomonas sp.]
MEKARATTGKLVSVLAMAAMLSSCGGSRSNVGSAVATVAAPTAAAPTPTPSPTPAAVAGCSLRERQDWVLRQMNDWYLFPETLPASLDPGQFSTLPAYIDALTATARAQRRDRFFTFITTISGENAFFNSGTSAGFGIRLLADSTGTRIFIAEAFEGAPALAAGIDRGTEILAVGTTANDLRTVSSIIAAEGTGGVTNALGPNTAGLTRVLRVADAAGTRTVTISKTDFELTPVSSRYGARIINDGGRPVGYLNLRTFIGTADAPLRQAFAMFRAQGVTNVILDFRYNGGGLVSIAELIGDLLGGARSTSETFSITAFRPERASNNTTRNFRPTAESVSPLRLAVIATRSTASASELVTNAMIPYLRANAALIGSNTSGKPVGQIGLDRAQCDDRLRVVAFATQNADRRGDYFDGLAGVVQTSCQAPDDVTRPLGDPLEGSTRQALSYLRGESCTPISTAQTGLAVGAGRARLLESDTPDTAQREVAGLF